MEDNISIMSLGNTQGALFAVKKMKVSNGGSGGRIITTASVLGLQVGTQGWGTYCMHHLASFEKFLIHYLIHFQSLGLGLDISSLGYGVAKWGNISMTRSFATCSPSVEADGVKSYALAPSFTDTTLARCAIVPQRNYFHWHFKFL